MPRAPDVPLAADFIEILVNESVAGISQGPRRLPKAEFLASMVYTNSAVYSTRAALFADLVPIALTIGLVIGDPIAGAVGIYQKVGGTGTGSWTQLTDFIPGAQIAIAVDVGAGTPDAIQATSTVPIGALGNQLILMNIFETNTSTTVTTRFNNAGNTYNIKTASGSNPPVGSLPSKVLGVISGLNFNLYSDISSAAIQAACLASQVAAAASATAAAGSATLALGAAFVTGPGYNYTTKAQATTALTAVPLPAAAIVDVVVDESRSNGWSRYEVVAGALVFRRDLSLYKYITPESFGVPGAAATDNALFVSALATGRPVLAIGPYYQLTDLDVPSSTLLKFAPGITVIHNPQTSGTKLPAIKAEGSMGATVAVTQVGTGPDVAATGVLTFSGVGTAGDRITIAGVNYTLIAAVVQSHDVLIGATATDTANNLSAAINAGAGAGTTYGTGTFQHPYVSSTAAAGVLTATARIKNTHGNLITTTENGTSTSWGAATLTGGFADYSADFITVASVVGLAVGDVLLLKENRALVDETYSPVVPATQYDGSFREFVTIASIVGSVLTFEELLRYSHDVAQTVTIQKVTFKNDIHIEGGRFTGGTGAGQGVSLTVCRNSSVKNIYGRGLLETNMLGGAPLTMDNCFECDTENINSRWTLFAANLSNNQSCNFDGFSSKRTNNGGIILSGNHFCKFDGMVLDAPGNNNGDALGMAHGNRNNTFGSLVVSGSRCYTTWIHQSCDGNTFESIKSRSGVTGAVYCFSDNNTFSAIDVKKHPSFGLGLYGHNNICRNIDIEVEGAAIQIQNGVNGNQVYGRAISTGSGIASFDMILGSHTNTTVEIEGGIKGVNQGGGTLAHASNKIVVKGPNPFSSGVSVFGRGYTYAATLTGITTTAKPIEIPFFNYITKFVSQNSTPNAIFYSIQLANNDSLDGSTSDWVVTDRSSAFQLTQINASAIAQTPVLEIVNGVVCVKKLADAGASIVFMRITKW